MIDGAPGLGFWLLFFAILIAVALLEHRHDDDAVPTDDEGIPW